MPYPIAAEPRCSLFSGLVPHSASSHWLVLPRACALYRRTVRHAPGLREGGGFARCYSSAWPGARLDLILFVQTFGDLVNYNPHNHVLAADGAFNADGSFTALPPIPAG